MWLSSPTMTWLLMPHMMISAWTAKPSSSVYIWEDMQAVQVQTSAVKSNKNNKNDFNIRQTLMLVCVCMCTGDAFRGYDQEHNQDTAPFSASDVDNDGCNPSCSINNRTVESCSAQHNHTGWWFNQCGLANLNASPEDSERNHGHRTHIVWDTWRQNGIPHNIKSVTMKFRRIVTNNWQRETERKHIL